MKRNSGKVMLLSVGLAGLMAASTAQGITANIPEHMREKIELVAALTAAMKPVIELQYKKEPEKLKQAQEILAMIAFLPDLIMTMDDLKEIIPSVPRETLEVFAKMQGSLKKAKVEFEAAKKATQLDEMAREVLAGLQNLQTGLEGPGDYLVTLNEKTFKKVLGLFEGLPTLGDKMTGTVGGRKVPISKILDNLFGTLKTITEKYSAGFKAMDVVINKLLEENARLKAELTKMRSAAEPSGEMQIQVIPVEQEDASGLLEGFVF
jgi:hypothetical protein